MEDHFIFLLENVSKTFGKGENKIAVIKDVSLSFPNKGLVGLVGKSGSGKSTLLNLLSGNEKATGGKIYYRNKNISALETKELERLRNKEFGFVYQYFNLIEGLSVLENVAMPLLIAGERKSKAFKKARDLLSSYNLSYLKKRKVDGLSGGEKQRIALLRAVINDPEVIFADEPTGALDQEHGLAVMDSLGKVSRDKLVIAVSHNEQLVDRYCDYKIRIDDGYVIENDLPGQTKKYETEKFAKAKGSHWKGIILRKHLKSDKAKNIFAVASSFIGFLTAILTIGFLNGSNIVSKEQTNHLLTRFVASVSKKETIKLENSPLSLIKVFRPEIDDIRNIVSENIDCEYDYSYFFPVKNTIKTDKKENYEVSLMPLMLKNTDTYQSFLIAYEDEKHEGNSCIVNSEFVSETSSKIGDRIMVDHELTLLIDERKENVSIHYEFYIDGIVSEFSFMNEPRLYYDYEDIYEYLFEYETDFGSSLIELVEAASSDSVFSSYQLKLFPLNEDGSDEIKNLSEKEGFSLVSNYLNVKESFDSLQQALSASLLPFLILELVAISFISGFISFSNFLSRKKEAAILNSLGARKTSLASVYSLEGMISLLIGMMLALISSIFFGKLLNGYFSNRLQLNDLISVPYSLLFVSGSLFFSSLLGYIGTRIPLRSLFAASLSEALREE